MWPSERLRPVFIYVNFRDAFAPWRTAWLLNPYARSPSVLGKWTLARHKKPVSLSSKAHCHNLLCFDLYELSRRSSGLVSRPLRDLSLSPCVTGHQACWPIRPRSKTCQGKQRCDITRSFLIMKTARRLVYNNINILQLYSSLCDFFPTPQCKKKKNTLLINNYFINLSLLFCLLRKHIFTKARMLNRFTCVQGKY